MASWDGSPGNGDDFSSKPPNSPSMRQLTHSPVEQLPPDTEENVVEQTGDVFRNFMYQAYRQEQSQQDFDSTPSIPELTTFTADPLSPAAQVGRQLAKIGDDINTRYADEFTSMIQQLNIDTNPETAYEAFAGVANKMFANGINWGRIITLLCFGYRMTMSILRVKERVQQFSHFVKHIIDNLVRYIKECIAKWIADQGGWRAALGYIPTVSWTTISFILGFAVLTVGGIWYFKNGS